MKTTKTHSHVQETEEERHQKVEKKRKKKKRKKKKSTATATVAAVQVADAGSQPLSDRMVASSKSRSSRSSRSRSSSSSSTEEASFHLRRRFLLAAEISFHWLRQRRQRRDRHQQPALHSLLLLPNPTTFTLTLKFITAITNQKSELFIKRNNRKQTYIPNF